MKVISFLRSLTLSLSLLLVLAVLAIPGTFLPTEAGALYYRSPLIVLPLGMLILNVTFCSWHRVARKLAGRGSGRRGRFLTLLDVLMHFSLVLIMAGGVIKSVFGFIGTQYLFVGVETDTAYDWKIRDQAPLGFTVLLKERVEDYYPFTLKVSVAAGTVASPRIILLREGSELQVDDLKLAIRTFDLQESTVTLKAAWAGGRAYPEFDLVPGGRLTAVAGPYELGLLAWRRDMKGIRGLAHIVEDGRVVKEQWLAVNGRIAHEGHSIFLTSWGEDQYHNPYLGVQVTSDPGAPVFWAGAVLLAATLPLFLAVRHRPQRRNAVASGRGDGVA